MESMTDEFRLAFETDRRFEFYITAAIFTILGVSVQTSEVYADRLRNVLALGGYFFLVISAACAAIALSRFVRRNWIVAEIEDSTARLRALQVERVRSARKPAEGADNGIDAEISDYSAAVASGHASAGNIKNLIRFTREMRNWALLLGLVLLLFARIWPTVASALDSRPPGIPG